MMVNKTDQVPDYKKIYSFVREQFQKVPHFCHGPFDETYFTLRVYESAKLIMAHLNDKVKVEPLLVATILHDIGKTQLDTSKLFDDKGIFKDFSVEWRTHPARGAPIAKNYLEKEGYSGAFIDEVCYLIRNHDQRNDQIKQKTIELKILQDADIIADIGFSGFIRPFLYCGKFWHQSIIDSIEFIKNEDRTAEGNKLNLEISKEIAKKEMQVQRQLVDKISMQLKTDLL